MYCNLGTAVRNVHGWAREWSLGCVNSLPAARGSQEVGFMQPRDHSFARDTSQLDYLRERMHVSYMYTLTDACNIMKLITHICSKVTSLRFFLMTLSLTIPALALPYLILINTAYSMSAAKTNTRQPNIHTSIALKDLDQ